MLKQTLVTGLLVLVTSFTVRAIEHTENFLTTDTSDLLRKDSLLPKLPSDPKSNMQEIPVADGIMYGISLEQMHPLAINFIEDYTVKFEKSLGELNTWATPHFHIIESIFEKHELPVELKYLAVVESKLQNRARSWAGAVGPWQFMPVTARTMGLKVTKYVDERRDLAKSTQAAAKYLKSLYKMYGDWLLVIAAYNGGPGNVNSAIRRSGSRDFWELQHYLPTESRNHVKKYIATQFIMAGSAGLTALTIKETERLQPVIMMTDGIEPELNFDIATLARPITGRYHSSIITKYVMMDINEFLAMNPAFDRVIASQGEFELRLPADKMEIFLARKPEILTESLQLLWQTVDTR